MKKFLLATAMSLPILTTVYAAECDVPPAEATGRGNIAWQANEWYKEAITPCLPRLFADCLEQKVRESSADLDAVVKGTFNYLMADAPAKTVAFRQSQQGWLQFQKANCTFARVLWDKKVDADKAHLDCMLHSIT